MSKRKKKRRMEDAGPEKDQLNNRYSILFPLILSLLFAIMRIFTQWKAVTSEDGVCSLILMIIPSLEILCDCLSSAFVPFVLLAAIQLHLLNIENGLNKERATMLYITALVHFGVYIGYLLNPGSIFFIGFMVVCCIASIHALINAVEMNVLKSPFGKYTPSGCPDDDGIKV